MEQEFGITKMGLFGSFSKNQQKKNSDIDIAIEMTSTENRFRRFFGLKRYLETHLKRKVDLGFEHCLKPSVRDTITILYV